MMKGAQNDRSFVESSSKNHPLTEASLGSSWTYTFTFTLSPLCLQNRLRNLAVILECCTGSVPLKPFSKTIKKKHCSLIPSTLLPQKWASLRRCYDNNYNTITTVKNTHTQVKASTTAALVVAPSCQGV